MALILWTNQAIEDLEIIGEYIERDSPKYASITLKRILSATQILVRQSKAGRIVPEFEIENIRELIEGRYRIVYKIVGADQIDILTIYHSSMLLKIV
ncbi:MAG: type II toxin-antitoxin system RelE/ParE family toxin [Bacteroidales bacterium]|nr:type II toxin-antitoxin system RelE/ParE family toxin [Bacteroidales bacterium]